MKKILASTLVLAMLALGWPAGAAAQQQTGGTIVGLAKDVRGLAIPNCPLRLRNIATGQVVKTGASSAFGEFSFTDVAAGRYVVEIVDSAGKVLGSSTQLSLATGATVGGVSVSISTVAPNAVKIDPRGPSFFSSTAHIVILSAVGAGVATAVYVATKSGSK